MPESVISDSVAIYGSHGNAVKFFSQLNQETFLFDSFACSNEDPDLDIAGIDLHISPATLSKLSISNSKLSNDALEFLPILSSLKYLCLSFNKLTDISCLSCLVLVKELDISHNKIENIVSLQSLRNLTLLRANHNMISRLFSLSSLEFLEELWIASNSIQWGELLYLSGLKRLKRMIKYGNPFEEKPKYKEFLLSLAPSLAILDGADVLLDKSKQEFMRSTDGRVMLTQAKAMASANKEGIAIPVVNRQSSRSLVSQDPPLFSTDSSDLPTSAVISTRNIGNGQDLSIAGINLASPVHKFKIPQRPILQKNSQSFNSLKRKSSAVNSSESNQVVVDSDFGVIGSHISGSGETRVDNEKFGDLRSPGKIIRFGPTSDSPVALCLYNNGDGYIRWSKTGSIACSLEKNRLFCSHRNGSIAVVVDASGSGSVMDSRGRTLLVLDDQGNAKIYDKKGIVVSEYTRSDKNVDTSDDVSLDSALVSGNKHSWSFDGLQIEFSPVSFEVCARMQNEKACALFSSVHGSQILPKLKDKKNKSRENPIIRSFSAAASRLQEEGDDDISIMTEIKPSHDIDNDSIDLQSMQGNHSLLRNNVKSIMSNLDEVMAQITKR